MTEIGLMAAFAAGIISFLSPCVLPLVPGYMSFISGVSLDELRADAVSYTHLTLPTNA